MEWPATPLVCLFYGLCPKGNTIMTKTLNAAQLKTVAATAEAAWAYGQASTTFADRCEELAKLPEALAKPKLAEALAAKYKVVVAVKVADRGKSVGKTVFVFGSGDYATDKVADACRKMFGRTCSEAWPTEAQQAADADEAANLFKALQRVVSGRAKLSVADRKKFAKLAAGVGVSFV